MQNEVNGPATFSDGFKLGILDNKERWAVKLMYFNPAFFNTKGHYSYSDFWFSTSKKERKATNLSL